MGPSHQASLLAKPAAHVLHACACPSAAHMLGSGDVEHQLRMQRARAQSAAEARRKGLLRRSTYYKQVGYLLARTSTVSCLPGMAMYCCHAKLQTMHLTSLALMKASSGWMVPATICSLICLLSTHVVVLNSSSLYCTQLLHASIALLGRLLAILHVSKQPNAEFGVGAASQRIRDYGVSIRHTSLQVSTIRGQFLQASVRHQPDLSSPPPVWALPAVQPPVRRGRL